MHWLAPPYIRPSVKPESPGLLARNNSQIRSAQPSWQIGTAPFISEVRKNCFSNCSMCFSCSPSSSSMRSSGGIALRSFPSLVTSVTWLAHIRTRFHRERVSSQFVVEARNRVNAIVEVRGGQAYTSGALISQENKYFIELLKNSSQEEPCQLAAICSKQAC